jgi:hypothetical protein
MTAGNKKKGFHFVMGIFMLLIGICIGLAGAYYAFQSWQLVAHGGQVDAVVVDLVYSPKPGSGRTAAPIYEYTVEGRIYRSRSTTKSYPHLLIGDRQTLLYDPKDPAQARENNFTSLWLLPSIIGAGSVLLILAAVVVIAVGKFFGISRKERESGFSIKW